MQTGYNLARGRDYWAMETLGICSIAIVNKVRPVMARQIYRNIDNFVAFIGLCESKLYTTIN